MRTLRHRATRLVALILAYTAARAHARATNEDARAEEAQQDQRPRYASKVTAGRQRATASERVIDAQTIAVTPLRSADDLFRLVPGLLLTRHGADGKGRQIFLRGVDAAHGADVEVMVGGMPANELSNVHGQGYLDLGLLIPEAVLTIDAQKGSHQLGQGPFAIAGSVRLELGVPAELRGYRMGYEAGSTGRHRLLLLAAPPSQPKETFVAIELLRDDGYGQNRATERAAGLTQVRLCGARCGGHLDIAGGAYAARFGEPGAVPLEAFRAGRLGFYDVYSRDTRGESDRAWATVRHRAAGRLGSLETTAWMHARRLVIEENFTGFYVDPVHGDGRRQVQGALGGGVRLRYQKHVARAPGLSLLAGADWMSEAIGQYEDLVDITGAPHLRSRDLDVRQHVGAVLVGAVFQPRPWVRLDLGARVDAFHFDVVDRLDPARDASGTVTAISPRFTSAFTLPRGFALYAAYGRGVRPPEARAFSSAPVRRADDVLTTEFQGGPAKLTTSDSTELGLRGVVRGPSQLVFEAGLTGFGIWIANEVVFDHVSGINVAVNSTRRVGAELELRLRPVPFFELLADLVYVDARFEGSGRPVPGSPSVFATVTASLFGWRGLRGQVRMTALGPRPLQLGATSGAAVLFDASLRYRWRFMEPAISLDNFTNAEWEEGAFQYPSYWDRDQPRSALPTIHYAAGPPLVVRGGITFWF